MGGRRIKTWNNDLLRTDVITQRPTSFFYKGLLSKERKLRMKEIRLCPVERILEFNMWEREELSEVSQR